MKLYESFLIGDEKNVVKVVHAAAAVIIKHGKYGEEQLLVLQRHEKDHWPNVWEFPRGKCDKPAGENLVDCCRREVKEETGLDIIVRNEISTTEYLADKGTRKTICHNFFAHLANPDQKVRLSEEHQDYKWISSMGLADLILIPDQKKIVQAVFNKAIRIIDDPDNDFSKNNTVEEDFMISEYLNLLQEEPCWKGYVMVGMKKKNGKMVPNCVPKNKSLKEEEEKKPLNKPFRLSGDRKKFGVYVKNDKGNTVMVKFGDPNMEIKRDDPERRKSFRARHGCDNPGPKWKAKYWSCKMWEKSKSVSDYLK
jgi:8-oxo-dGTP pyrophosphatase MutT (NUDIX family)